MWERRRRTGSARWCWATGSRFQAARSPYGSTSISLRCVVWFPSVFQIWLAFWIFLSFVFLPGFRLCFVFFISVTDWSPVFWEFRGHHFWIALMPLGVLFYRGSCINTTRSCSPLWGRVRMYSHFHSIFTVSINSVPTGPQAILVPRHIASLPQISLLFRV